MASVDLEDDLREYSGNRVSKLKKLKADRERWVQEYKKGLADDLIKIQDLSTGEDERKQAKSNIDQHIWEDAIQDCKRILHAVETELAAAAEKEAVSDLESRDRFSEAKKQKCVRFKSKRGVISGFAGTGKSHVLAILLDEPPPSKRVSTAVTTTPVRAMSNARMEMSDKQFSRITDEMFTKRLLKTAKDGVVILPPGGVMGKLRGKLRKTLIRPPQPTDQVEKDLIVKFHQLDGNVESLEGHIVCELSDCGGQPQFLEMLPRFLENLEFAILVTNLNLDLDDYPLNYYYNKDGVSVGEGVKSPLTNEQVLRLCLRMIASQSRGGRHVSFVFVGTHRDLERRSTESREEKNRRLMEMVKSFGLEDSVIHKCPKRKELLFAINAKDPEEVDYQTNTELKIRLLNESKCREVSIPVSYHAVELTLKRKVQDSGHIAFLESDILKEVAHFKFSEETLKKALRYLHEMKVIFYYEVEFPGKVIGEPQVVLNKHTEVVAYHIELSTNPQKQLSLDRKWLKFVQHGVLNVECLKKFPDHYVEGVFSPADMMKLFEKLLMVSEVSNEEYLMPCVLQADHQAKCNPEPETQSVPPLVLHFPGGPARYGVYCGTICHVMTESKWKILTDPDTEEPLHVTRNSVHFSVPHCQGKVTINDTFDSFFLVTVHVPRDVPEYSKCVSHMCMEIRDTLVSAITDVTKQLNYDPDTPEVAFLCKEHKTTPLHPATVNKFGNELLCSKCANTRGGPLTPQHMVWLKDVVNIPDLQPHGQVDLCTSSTSNNREPHLDIPPPGLLPVNPSSIKDVTSGKLNIMKWRAPSGEEKVLRLKEEMSVKWRELGQNVGISDAKLTDFQEFHLRSNGMCMDSVSQEWIKKGSHQKYPANWEGLIKLLRDVELNNLADQILEALADPDSTLNEK